MQNVPLEHSAILLTFIKRVSDLKTYFSIGINIFILRFETSQKYIMHFNFPNPFSQDMSVKLDQNHVQTYSRFVRFVSSMESLFKTQQGLPRGRV